MATEFNTQTGGGQYRLQFETDNEEYFLLMQELARCCVDHPRHRTNADKIRALSDDQLANHIIGIYDLDNEIGFCKNLPECDALLETDDGIPASKCAKCLLEWLRQPAEVSE